MRAAPVTPYPRGTWLVLASIPLLGACTEVARSKPTQLGDTTESPERRNQRRVETPDAASQDPPDAAGHPKPEAPDREASSPPERDGGAADASTDATGAADFFGDPDATQPDAHDDGGDNTPTPGLCSPLIPDVCELYCDALSAPGTCADRYDPGTAGGVNSTPGALRERCECSCTAELAFPACSSFFSDYITCGGSQSAPTLICPVDPNALPNVTGTYCARYRGLLEQCLADNR